MLGAELDDDEPQVDDEDATPLDEVAAGDRKSPTIDYTSDMTMEFQSLPLRANDPQATFHIDGKRIASRSWPLRPGKHVITARNERGARDEVAIWVK